MKPKSVILLALVMMAPAAAAQERAASSFAALERHVLAAQCAMPGCHGGPAPAGNLDLTAGKAWANLVGVKAARRPDRLLVAPGKPEQSYLLERLLGTGDTPVMPIGADRLPAEQLERLRAWIRDGARR